MKTIWQLIIIVLVMAINLAYTDYMIDITVDWRVLYACAILGLLGIGLMFLAVHRDEHPALPLALGVFGTLGLALIVWYCFRTIGHNDLRMYGELAQQLVGLFYAILGCGFSLPLAVVNTVGLYLYRWVLRQERERDGDSPTAIS